MRLVWWNYFFFHCVHSPLIHYWFTIGSCLTWWAWDSVYKHQYHKRALFLVFIHHWFITVTPWIHQRFITDSPDFFSFIIIDSPLINLHLHSLLILLSNATYNWDRMQLSSRELLNFPISRPMTKVHWAPLLLAGYWYTTDTSSICHWFFIESLSIHHWLIIIFDYWFIIEFPLIHY